jgi:hypothetical protein
MISEHYFFSAEKSIIEFINQKILRDMITPNENNIIVAQWPDGSMIGTLKGVLGDDYLETFIIDPDSTISPVLASAPTQKPRPRPRLSKY